MENEKKKKKYSLIPMLVGIILILLLSSAIVYFFINSKKVVKEVETTIVETTEEVAVEPIKEPEVIDTSITLAFCGDTMVHIPQALDAYNIEEKNYDFIPSLKYIKEDIEEADYAVTNLETVLSGDSPTGYPRFCAPDEIAEALKYAGFDLVATANNHILDKKFDGLKRTLDILDSNGLDHVGTTRTKEEYEQTKGTFIKNIKGYKIGFINLSKGTNGFSEPKENPYAVNVYTKDYFDSEYQKNVDYDKIKEMITYLKDENVDCIVALMHWGLENYRDVAPQQEKVAAFLRENGVKIIVGNHPNVLQRYEYDDNLDALTMYSMGNIISSQTHKFAKDSAIMYTKLDKDVNGKIVIKEIYYKPVTIMIRDRGLTPRFMAVNTHKTLSNLWTREDNTLLSYMTKSITEDLINSITKTHKLWGDFLDFYKKYDLIKYNYIEYQTEENKIIFKQNEENNKNAEKKLNWVK